MIKYPLEDKEELEKSIIAETNDFLNILKRDLRPNTRFFATISSNNSANAAKSDEKKNKRKSKLINKVDDGGELTNKGKRKKPDTTVEKNKSKKRDKKIKNKMVIDSVIDDANKQPKLSEEENLETIKEKQNKKKQRKTSMTPVTSKMKNPGSLSMILNLDNNITFDQSNIHSTTTNSSISSDDE
ncbi:10113_t:CDS:2 [Entrophospora sp. SA101]|nr:13518_t:CDS:2 [Entrophospora sp. SA101]CAJ0763624.1 3236_t:CDS:2 [Entrophospora sp. SA101]CAJ0766097.1 10113_t:CDS:2 [Entrophospora sp. SA101]